jgi:hypothetical protein
VSQGVLEEDMTTAVQAERRVFMHGAERDFTAKEIGELIGQASEAYSKKDWDEFDRLAKTIPFEPIVAKAIKNVYGKAELLSGDYDLTEANLVFGEGWLDESERYGQSGTR